MPNRLSVLLVHWNTKDDLRDSLIALREHPYSRGEQEVIVVDNASEDGAAEMVRISFPAVRLIANPTNELYAHGVNQCAEAASGDLLLLLNPDAQVQAGTLDTLAAFLHTKPDAAAVARSWFTRMEKFRRRCADSRRRPRFWESFCCCLAYGEVVELGRRGGCPWFDYESAGEAPQPMASCFLIRRDAWEKIGAMDERFPLYFNDADWCLRAYNSGYRIYYTPTRRRSTVTGDDEAGAPGSGLGIPRAMLRFLASITRARHGAALGC
jgi:GT2 family glycosyltransferase